MTKLIKQANRPGLYTSDIINERYQVLESDVFKNTYFVYDLTKDDILRQRDGSTKYFDDLAAATAVAEGAAPAETAKAPRAPKPVKVKAPKVTEPKPAKEPKGKEAKSTEPKAKRPSANAMILELIKTTALSDEEISAEVLKVFTDSKSSKPYDVKYRRRLVAAGKL